MAVGALLMFCAIDAQWPSRTGPVKAGSGAEAEFPQAAAEYLRSRQVDETGKIPVGARVKASQQAKAMALAGEASILAADLTRGGWDWIGPGNIGGRVRSIAVHPTTPGTLFAGSATGGLWKTTNSGGTWAPVADFMGNLAVSTVVYSPANPLIMYAGTGEGLIQGEGIFKSIDGGTTWTQLASTANGNFLWVNRIAVSSSGNTILAATTTGMWRSINAGAGWSQVLDDGPMSDVKFLASSSSLVVAAGLDRNAYYSTNAGFTWTAATGLAARTTRHRVELAVAGFSAQQTIYASVDANQGEIWRSTDGGRSYRLLSNPRHLQTQGSYDNAIWVDPTNANHVVTGGIRIYRSTDGGASFADIQGVNYPIHVDIHAIVADLGYDGNANRRMFVGTDGGVYRPVDIFRDPGDSAWIPLNNNLGVTQFYGGAGNPDTGTIIGGTQDNGTLVYMPAAGPQAWTAIENRHDGGMAVADWADSRYFYGEHQWLQIFRNDTSGTGATSLIYGEYNGVCKPAPYRIDDACTTGNTLFIAPFIQDPRLPWRLYAGGLSLWRTDDARAAVSPTTGPIWKAIKAPLEWGFVSAIAVAPSSDSQVVWVGYDTSEVFLSVNGKGATPTWTKVDSAQMPSRFVTSITTARTSSQIAFVTFGGFSTGNVWKTTDRGATWAAASGSGSTALPAAPVYGFAIHPVNANWVYAATEVGIFASADGGATWSLPHDAPSDVSVNQLFWMGQKLVAVTYGRGMYVTKEPLGLQAPTGLTASVNRTGPPLVTLSWLPSAGATTYTVKRGTVPGQETSLVSGLTQAGYVDSSATRATTYYYVVTASSPTFGSSTNSSIVSVAIPRYFTDDPVLSRGTIIRAAHLTELRTAVATVRARLLLPPVTWTESTISARGTVIRAQHFLELQAAIIGCYIAAKQTPPTFTTITPRTPITAAMIAELRAAIAALM